MHPWHEHMAYVDRTIKERWLAVERHRPALERILRGDVQYGDGAVAVECVQMVLLQVARNRARRYEAEVA
jgi:hypothetical protein